MTCEQSPLHGIETDVVHVHGGVGSPLHTQRGQIVGFPKRTATLQRVSCKILAFENDAQPTCVGTIGDDVLRRQQRQVHLEFVDATVQTDRFHAIFIHFHDAVVVRVVSLLEPCPNLQQARQTFGVADLQPQGDVFAVHGDVVVRGYLLS